MWKTLTGLRVFDPLATSPSGRGVKRQGRS
jgi:hypothetical protein